MIRRPPRSTLFSLHDALPIFAQDLLVELVPHVALAALELKHAVRLVPEELAAGDLAHGRLQRVVGHAAIDEARGDRKSTRLNSSHANISYAVFCLKKTTNDIY